MINTSSCGRDSAAYAEVDTNYNDGKMNSEQIQSRIRGALYGAVVGDALGVPYEFLSREEMKRNPATGMTGYGTYNQQPGTWSDDSSLLLCTTESLSRGFDVDDMARLFLRWYENAYMTPHGEVFDIGNATAMALRRISSGVPVEEAGCIDEGSNGNGSLMRILPVALKYRDLPAAQLLDYAARVSAITHAHPRSQLACGIYCLLISEILRGHGLVESLERVRESLPDLLQTSPMEAESTHFERLFQPDFSLSGEDAIQSSGYVLHTLEAAIWCVHRSGSYEEAVLRAVNLGLDTDTTACVTGGLAGALYGFSAIPEEWLMLVKNPATVKATIDSFISSLEG